MSNSERAAKGISTAPVMTDARDTGIGLVGAVPWGSHFCQFYRTGEDILDIIVPYFQTGLENNEYCMWVTSPFLSTTKAEAALAAAIPGIERYRAAGQIEIIPHTEWYLKDGYFDADRVLAGWVSRLEAARSRGFDGLRLTGDTFWLQDAAWRDFNHYEAAVDKVIGDYEILAICTYSLERCGAAEIIDVVSTHEFAMVKDDGGWQLIEATARRQAAQGLRERELELATIYDSIPLVMLLVDSQRRVHEVNPAAVSFASRPAFELLNKRGGEALGCLHSMDVPEGCGFGPACGACPLRNAVLETFRTREGHSQEEADFTLIKNGEPQDVTVLFSTGWLMVKGEPRVLVTIQDITDRKRSELALTESLARIKQSNADLQQFAYAASHDLREPLRMVTNFLELLEQRYAGTLDNDAREFIGFAVDGASRMQEMINDLLAFSRLGGKTEDLDGFDMGQALEEALKNLRTSLDESSASVTHGELPVITGDAAMMTQLLQNLIGNAIKFRGDASPRVRIEARKSNGDWLFSVADNGIGIDPEFRDRIFAIFQRLHSRVDYPGTGIGLAICKRIVERHGGRIWVESKPEEGSTFFFTIPAQPF